MKKQLQKAFSAILVVTLILSQGSLSFANEKSQINNTQAANVNKEVFAYLRSDVKIKMDGKMYVLFDAKGQNAYPIIYGNKTYLPVRGLSAVLDKNIEWESSNRTIYIGKTLKYLHSENRINQEGEIREAVQIASYKFVPSLENRQITVSIRNDIRILYNFEEKLKRDSEYYTLNYNGTIYLPLRAVSEMLSLKIDWNDVEKTVSMSSIDRGSSDSESKETESDKAESGKADLEKEKLLEKARHEQFKKVAESKIKELDELGKRATDNLVALRKESSEEIQKMYADAIAQICVSIELQKNSAEFYKNAEATEEEKALIEAVKEYNEMLYHYTLVMENISYLAVSGQDFSMLSDTFVQFALGTQSKRQFVGRLLEEMQ